MTLDDLIESVAFGLRNEPTPSEDEIEERLSRIGRAFDADEETLEAARRELHARFRVRMDKGITLEAGDHRPWVAARRADLDWYYWRRFRNSLSGDPRMAAVVPTLDQTTDDVLDLMGDPHETGAWRRRGLVMGEVQVGKTATYTALISKAADAGYKLVVLLTGTLENVRRQTQKRLDEGFVGFDSGDWLVRGRAQRTALVGVGQLDHSRQAIVFTSRTADFKAALVNALNLSLAAVREPVLVVCKKNASILNNLTSWLRAKNLTAGDTIDLPLLLIDDEADNASINTRHTSGDVTAINRGIRGLLALFRRSSYCGFTATPFANIFIEPDTTDAMFGDDLFPADFIHVLGTPDNYVGMNRLFTGPEEPEGEIRGPAASSDAGRIVRTIEDADDWLPIDHEKDDDVMGLSSSLLTAFRAFLLGCAIRDLRAADGDTFRGGGIHRSMLVNVSRFTDVQDRVADALRVELDRIRDAVRVYGALEPTDAAAASSEITALAALWKKEFSHCGKPWDRVLGALHQAIGPVDVRSVNQRTGAASLDYAAVDGPPGLRVVAVGGQSLSRGLTLEGLQVSYFLRNSRAYDTLMQMARWFGYRDGYHDTCRVWLTDEAEAWYRHVTSATQELRRDFRRMCGMRATPRDFGLRVRRHPDTLLITARNKMASGENVAVLEREVSLEGRGVETSRLHADVLTNRQNLEHVKRFLERLEGEPTAGPIGGALVWRGVPGESVADLLRAFAVHPHNHDFQGDVLAEHLDAGVASNDLPLSCWTVALLTGGMGIDVPLPIPSGYVRAQERHVKEKGGSLLVSGRSARVGDKRHVRQGLLESEWAALKQAYAGKDGDLPEDEVRAVLSAPLLVLYLLQGKVKEGEGERYKEGLVLPALALHFPGRSQPGEERVMLYRLNRQAQAELRVGIDEDEAADDDDLD